jgi:hypothetical protein
VTVEEYEAEIARLNKCLMYEQHIKTHIGTHSQNCHTWGPQHYECLLRKHKQSLESQLASAQFCLTKLESISRFSPDISHYSSVLAELRGVVIRLSAQLEYANAKRA